MSIEKDFNRAKEVGLDYQLRPFLSSGLNPLYVGANGVPFNGNYVVASGNLAADMTSNIAAESTGRQLACRLYEMADDPGMKDMLAYLIVRDTMHQNQWIEILKALGNPEDPYDVVPMPDSFPDEAENQEFNYAFISTNLEKQPDPESPWTSGTAPDNERTFSYFTQRDLEGYDPEITESDPVTFKSPVSQGEYVHHVGSLRFTPSDRLSSEGSSDLVKNRH